MPDLRPAPVLAIGITRTCARIRQSRPEASTESAIRATLLALHQAWDQAARRERVFFDQNTPRIRLVVTGATPEELSAVIAACDLGADIVFLLGFPWETLLADLEPAIVSKLDQRLSSTVSVIELPDGGDGDTGRQRARQLQLSHIDLLVGFGSLPEDIEGNATIADALAARLPILVVDPAAPENPPCRLFRRHTLVPRIDGEIEWQSLTADLADYVRDIMAPPAGEARRLGLRDLLSERLTARPRRFEYPLLIRLFAGTRAPLGGGHAGEAAGAPAPGPNAASLRERPPEPRVSDVRSAVDRLAIHYAQLYRSSVVAQYGYVTAGIWLSGILGLLVPKLGSFSIALQLIGNLAVLLDSLLRDRGRWQERWLDYRVVAEQLRWMGLRSFLGFSVDAPTRLSRAKPSWTDWYTLRWIRGGGLPSGRVKVGAMLASQYQLTEHEIGEQIGYHRQAFRQLSSLETRLSATASLFLVGAAAVGLALAASVLQAGSLAAVGWRPFALVMLSTLPGTMSALNGLRVDTDLVRLVERSAQTIAMLQRLRRDLREAPRDYEHIDAASRQLNIVLGGELAEWRFVIESRRARRARGRRSMLRRLLSSFRRPRSQD